MKIMNMNYVRITTVAQLSSHWRFFQDKVCLKYLDNCIVNLSNFVMLQILKSIKTSRQTFNLFENKVLTTFASSHVQHLEKTFKANLYSLGVMVLHYHSIYHTFCEVKGQINLQYSFFISGITHILENITDFFFDIDVILPQHLVQSL